MDNATVLALQVYTGLVLIALGVLFLLLGLAAWLGWLRRAPGAQGVALTGTTNFWDVLLELAKGMPWMAVVGLFLVYAGVRLMGVELK
jgi:hypothetical protein